MADVALTAATPGAFWRMGGDIFAAGRRVNLAKTRTAANDGMGSGGETDAASGDKRRRRNSGKFRLQRNASEETFGAAGRCPTHTYPTHPARTPTHPHLKHGFFCGDGFCYTIQAWTCAAYDGAVRVCCAARAVPAGRTVRAPYRAFLRKPSLFHTLRWTDGRNDATCAAAYRINYRSGATLLRVHALPGLAGHSLCGAPASLPLRWLMVLLRCACGADFSLRGLYWLFLLLPAATVPLPANWLGADALLALAPRATKDHSWRRQQAIADVG